MKKLLLCMLAGISLLSAGKAQAYTIDEIVNSSPYMIASLKHLQDYWFSIYVNVMRSNGVRLEKVDDTHLKICDFEARYDFVFTLTNASGVETANGTYLSIYGAVPNTNQEKTNNTAYEIFPIVSTNMYQGAYNWNKATQYKLQIKTTNSGHIVFGAPSASVQSRLGYFVLDPNSNTPNGCAAVITDCTYAPFSYYEQQYADYQPGVASDRFDDYVYKSGAAASSEAPRYTRRIRSEERSYPVLVKMDYNTHTLNFINIANRGFGYNPTAIDIVAGSFTDDGTCEISTNYYFYKHYNQGSGYNASEGFDGYCITAFNPAASSITETPVKGTYRAVDVAHNEVPVNWVTNGGSLKTFEGIEMQFDPFALKNGNITTSSSTKLVVDGGYFDTKLLFGSDVTNDVELVIDDFGTSTTQARVVGHIVTNKNDKYVDHYELCIVPGKHTSIHSDSGFEDPTAQNGHPSAVNLFDEAYNYGLSKVAARADASTSSHDYTFDKIIDKTEAGSDPANQYTFFIKTVYTDPSLSPTFHSMKTIEGKTTGIESVGADLDSDAPAEYFNLQGIPVANPTHGIYLRRQGTRTTKVTL